MSNLRDTASDSNTPCKHGNRHYCGFCAAEKATKCKHGNPFFCGFCLAEKGEGGVPPCKWRVDDFGGSDTIAISCESPEGGQEVLGLGAKSESPTGAKERFIRKLVADANAKATLVRIVREEIAMLRQWAHESVRNGRPTHQVEPMWHRADMLEQAMMGD